MRIPIAAGAFFASSGKVRKSSSRGLGHGQSIYYPSACMWTRGPACKDVLDSVLRVDPGRRSRSIRQYALFPDGGGRRVCLSVARVFETMCIPKGTTAQKEHEYPNGISDYKLEVRNRKHPLRCYGEKSLSNSVRVEYTARQSALGMLRTPWSPRQSRLQQVLYASVSMSCARRAAAQRSNRKQ